MSSNKTESEGEPLNVGITTISGETGTSYWITPHLRYAKKQIRVDEQTSKYELRLQQMWQGQDGTQRWEWIEEVE